MTKERCEELRKNEECKSSCTIKFREKYCNKN